MDAKTTQSAAASTSGAETPASQAGDTPGANTAKPDELDIAGALGLPAEGQETDTEEAEPVETEPTAEAAEESADDAEGDEATEAAEAEPGKSDDAEAPSDEAAAEPGASEEKAEEKPADGEGKEKTPEWVQKRFDEMTAARHTAMEEARQLREENATLRAAARGELQGSPLDFIDTPEKLTEHQRDIERLNQWAIQNRQGGRLGAGDSARDYTAEEVAAIEAQTTADLRTHLPERATYVRAKQAFDQAAVKAYPWLGDTKQGDGATAQAVIERYPQLRVLPNYRLVVANAMQANKLLAAGIVIDDALIARLTQEAKAKAPASAKATAGKPAAKPAAPPRRPPPAPARPGTLPARSSPRAAQQRAAEDRVTSGSASMDDIASSIAAKL